MDQGVAAGPMSMPCYALVDLYGQCVQVRRAGNGTLGGVDQGVAAGPMSMPCYALVDLYGQCVQVRRAGRERGGPGGGGRADVHAVLRPGGSVRTVCAGEEGWEGGRGVDQGVAAGPMSMPCYALVDLYGQCVQVRRAGREREGWTRGWRPDRCPCRVTPWWICTDSVCR